MGRPQTSRVRYGSSYREEDDKLRSGLEAKVIAKLRALRIDYEYETKRIPYETRPRTYVPDIILPNGIIIEIKGWFKSQDRAKHKYVKAQHPELDIRFVFGNPHTRLSKKSKTTYAKWCDTHGFKWAHGSIPDEWLDGLI